jgi:hypothetical protein
MCFFSMLYKLLIFLRKHVQRSNSSNSLTTCPAMLSLFLGHLAKYLKIKVLTTCGIALALYTLPKRSVTGTGNRKIDTNRI